MLSARTADNVSSTEITITFGSKTLAHCYNSYTCQSPRFNTRRISVGNYTAVFTAQDAEGNEARGETITLMKNP